MKGFKIIMLVLLACFCLICKGENDSTSSKVIIIHHDSIVEATTLQQIEPLFDSTICKKDTIPLSKHDYEAYLLFNMYAELLDIEKQIRITHNTLVDLNFMNPGVERKIQQKLDGLNGRLNIASAQLDTITDKEAKTKSKPYKITVKDLKQKVSKCYNMLKKKSKM